MERREARDEVPGLGEPRVLAQQLRHRDVVALRRAHHPRLDVLQRTRRRKMNIFSSNFDFSAASFCFYRVSHFICDFLLQYTKPRSQTLYRIAGV